MIFQKTPIEGCVLITRDIPYDARGYFSRIIDEALFREHGLNAHFVQISASRNEKRGTLRGLHSQTGEHAEDKLVACVEGEVYDVCVDTRPDSKTYLQFFAANLSERNGNSLYIPKGCAHGFFSLTDHVQLIYFMTSAYHPAAERGYRWNDPAFGISWPGEPQIISDKDRSWPLLSEE